MGCCATTGSGAAGRRSGADRLGRHVGAAFRAGHLPGARSQAIRAPGGRVDHAVLGAAVALAFVLEGVFVFLTDVG